jgi:hypothetical protein
LTEGRFYLGRVVRVQVAPTGRVLECRVVSSELKTPELEAKLLATFDKALAKLEGARRL